MGNTCYIISPLFPLHCYSQVATNFIFFWGKLLSWKETFHQHKWVGWSLRDLSCWKRRKRVRLVLFFVNQNGTFSHWTHRKFVENWSGEWSFYAWLENGILVPVRILPVELNILRMGQLIPACVHIFWVYTWKYLVSHLRNHMFVEISWNSCYMVVQKAFF